MDREEYCLDKLSEIESFSDQVKQLGFKWFSEILDETWFSDIRNGGSKVWLGELEKYDCRFFPFRWLYEENEWNFISSWIGKLAESTKKIKILREKLKDIVVDDWMIALSTALEIKANCCFVRDNVLVDIDPKVNPNNPNNHKVADSLIKIKDRHILVEITACTRSLANPLVKVGTLSVSEMTYQIISKIKEKATKQLFNAQMPVVLIISLPPQIGADHYSAKWAIDDCLSDYPQISSILIADSYLFKYGAWYFNHAANYPLMEEEKQYVSKLIILNNAVKDNPNTFGIF